MKHIIANSASDAWIKASNEVLNNGEQRGDLIEILNGIIEINGFSFNDNFDRNFRNVFGNDRIDFASSVTFIQPSVSLLGDFAYLPIGKSWKDTYFGRMVNWQGQYNQLENCLKILKQGIAVKRCEIIIYDPILDSRNMYKQPCLLSIDLKPRDGKLTLTAFFRSQAVSKSGYADYTALINLGQFLAKNSNLELKTVLIHATSLHVRKQNKELTKTKELLDLI